MTQGRENSNGKPAEPEKKIRGIFGRIYESRFNAFNWRAMLAASLPDCLRSPACGFVRGAAATSVAETARPKFTGMPFNFPRRIRARPIWQGTADKP